MQINNHLLHFYKIYILNLHGNSIKQEKCPDGSKDENVFDIRVGVSIIFAIKTSKNNAWGKVYYQDLYGLREDKFAKLQKGEFEFKEVKIGNQEIVILTENAQTETTTNTIDMETVTETEAPPPSYVSEWGETYISSVPISYPENGEYIKFKDYIISDRMFNLNRTHISLGYDKNNIVRDEFGRPMMFVNLQNTYGDKYNGLFVIFYFL